MNTVYHGDIYKLLTADDDTSSSVTISPESKIVKAYVVSGIQANSLYVANGLLYGPPV